MNASLLVDLTQLSEGFRFSMIIFGKLNEQRVTLSGKSFCQVMNKITNQYIKDSMNNLFKDKIISINITHNEMQDQKILGESLMLLAYQILGKNQHNQYQKLQLGRDLFLDIDRAAFKTLFARWGWQDFSSFKQAIESYYNSNFNENILWNSQLIERYSDELIVCFIFIFDLALKTGKDSYIQRILTMQQEQQISLHPFVAAIAQREQFVETAELKITSEKEHVFALEDENDKLIVQRDEWVKKYKDLKESYDYLKSSHDRQSDQLNFLKQERYQLINELGGSQCGSLEETIQKVRKELTEYQHIVDKLQRELEEKKTTLKQRDEQMRNFQETFKANRYLEKVKQLDEMILKVQNLQKELRLAQNKEEEAKHQLHRQKTILRQKEEEIQNLNHRLGMLSSYEEKYQVIKKLHSQFKSRMIKDFKEKV